MPFFPDLIDDRGATFGSVAGGVRFNLAESPGPEEAPYRYELWRIWDVSRPVLLFLMLNPSTADAFKNDPTVVRCIGFAKEMKFGGIRVCNLYAFRATKPEELFTTEDPIGPENDKHIRTNVLETHNAGGTVIAAWGNPLRWPKGRRPSIKNRDIYVCELIKDAGVPLHVLSLTERKYPRHPLYARKHETPKRWIVLND